MNRSPGSFVHLVAGIVHKIWSDDSIDVWNEFTLQRVYIFSGAKTKTHIKKTPSNFTTFCACAQQALFCFVDPLVVAMTSIFGLLDKRQRAEARRKKFMGPASLGGGGGKSDLPTKDTQTNPDEVAD